MGKRLGIASRTRFFRLVVLSGASHAAGVFLSLAFAVLAARLLSVEAFGEVRTAMSLLPFVMAASLTGFDAVILRRAHMGMETPLRRIFLLRVTGAFLGTCALLFFAVWRRAALGETLFFLLSVLAILLPLFETGTGFRNYLIGRRLRFQAVQLSLKVRLASCGLFAAACAGIVWASLPPLYLFPAYLTSVVVPTLWAFLSLARRQEARRRSLPVERKDDLFPSALFATLAGLAAAAVFSIDKLWVRHAMGAEALASYAVLALVPQEGARVLEAILPLFYRRLFFQKNAASPHVRLRVLAVLAAFPVAGLYGAAFYVLSPYVFGPAYRYDGFSVALSCLMLLGASLEFYASHAVFARTGSGGLLRCSLANLAVTALTVYVCVSVIGGLHSLMIGLAVKQSVLSVLFLRLSFPPRALDSR